MKTPPVERMMLATVLLAGSLAFGQQPTPFGTPSLLPVQGQYAQWQSNQMVHPVAQNVAPTSTQPVNYGPLPSTYQAPPSVPYQYAAARMQTPQMNQQVPSVVQPPVLNESIAPGTQGGGSQFYGNAGETAGWSCGAAGCDPCCEPTCGPVCEPCCGPGFYASIGGLIFNRNRPRFHQVSFDDTDLVGQVLSTDTGLGRWDFGGEATFGWYLNPCCGTALELTYWGLYGDRVETTVLAASLVGNLNTVFDLTPLNIGATNVNDLFDAAQAHRIRRDYDVHNIEVNLLGGRFPGMTSGCFQASYLGGFRYLRFSEDFYYASADASPAFGADPANEGYYDINVRNNLWGFQLGGRADWYLTPRFSIYAAPKFGLYANYMEHHSRIYNGNGAAVVGPGNPLAGGLFDIESDKTIASFIGEVDLGLNYQFTPCLGVGLGYRAVAISGLAFATDQIPSHFADLPGVAMIDSNADMVLHGGYAAVTLTW